VNPYDSLWLFQSSCASDLNTLYGFEALRRPPVLDRHPSPLHRLILTDHPSRLSSGFFVTSVRINQHACGLAAKPAVLFLLVHPDCLPLPVATLTGPHLYEPRQIDGQFGSLPSLRWVVASFLFWGVQRGLFCWAHNHAILGVPQSRVPNCLASASESHVEVYEQAQF
jgi:hypothetical protein